MPSDDELRRVAEDVRALARSLGRDVRAAMDRARDDVHGHGGNAADDSSSSSSDNAGRRSAREDLAAAGRAARDELRAAQLAVRQSARRHHHGWRGQYGEGVGDVTEEQRHPYRGPRPGGPPRWDNWGHRRYRDAAGVRPGGGGWGGGWRGRPMGPPPPTGPQVQASAPPVPVPPLRHRHDGSTLLGLLAVVFGLAWLVAGTHVARVSTEAVVAIALMVLGAATVVTARTDWALSRRKWPVIGGAALVLTLLAVSASSNLPVGFRTLEFGSRTFTSATWTDLPPPIHGGFGRTVVDLSGVSGPLDAPKTLAVDNAAGRIEVRLPTNVRVVVHATIAGGLIEINGVPTSGLRRVADETLSPTAPGDTLTLQVVGGFGAISINQGVVEPSPPVDRADPEPLEGGPLVTTAPRSTGSAR